MKNKLLFLLISFISINTFFSQQTTITVDAAANGTTTNTCNGFIIDSGGQGGTGYSNNENTTFTICPDNPDDIINVQFNLFNLDPTDQNPLPNVTNVDEMSIYDGNSTAALFLGNYSGTGLQGVLVQCTPQNLTGCLTFNFYSNNVGGAGAFSASATCTTPCDDPTAGGIVLSGITNDSIHACMNEVIDFQELGSFAQPGFTISEYKWDFMDGSTSLGQSVSHSYAFPGHYRVQLFVKDNNGCTNNNLIDVDVLVATPPNFVNFQGDTTLCIGESMIASATPLLYENTWEGFTGETTINNGCMTDDQLGVAQNVDIVQTGFTSGTTITDMNQILSLCMDMEHSFMGDLVISIACPNGQSVILHQQGGGGTQIGEPIQEDNVDCTDPTTQGVPYSYCFTPTATTTWVEWANGNGGTIPVGNYEPVISLGGLVGCPANGVWTLTVVDNWAADDGTVFSFALNLDPALYPDVVEFTPEHSSNLDSSYWTFPAPFASNLTLSGDTMIITPTAAGIYTYQYTVVNNFGCSNDTTFNINVTEFQLPITLSDTAICAGNLLSLVDFPPCNYTLKLYDSFGDSWNGNNLLMTRNGVTTTYTVDNNPGDFDQFSIPVNFGDNLSFVFDDGGSFLFECSYEILDCSGTVIYTANAPISTTPNIISVGLSFPEPVSFTWSPAGFFDTLVNSTNPEVFIQNDISVSVNVYPTAHPLCNATAVMNITVLPNSYVGQDSTVSICQTTQMENLFTYLGPGANPNGVWIDPNLSPIVMPIDPVTMLEGDYVYSLNAGGCTGSATITVNKFTPTITNVVINDATCVNAFNGSAEITGTNFSSFSVNGSVPQLIQSPAIIGGLNEGFHLISMFGSPSCQVDTLVFVNDPDSLAITFITPPSVICVGDTSKLTVNASGGSSPYIYTWTLNGTVVDQLQSVDVIPQNPFNNYCVTLTEQCGSTSVTECTVVEFDQNILPLLSISDPDICLGEISTFTDITASPNAFASLVTFGDGDSLMIPASQTSFIHQYDSIKSYSLTMTTVSLIGCVYNNAFTNMLEIHPNPTANFAVNPDVVSSMNPEVTLINVSSQDVVKSSWYMPMAEVDTATTEDASAKYPLAQEGDYNVTLFVENFYGCRDSITKTILVQNEMTMYIPNSFTPNGDEFNNTWIISTNGIDLQNFTLLLYNRWGELIYESHDPSIGWDGTFGDELVQAGIYQWSITGINLLTGIEFERHGFLNIFR